MVGKIKAKFLNNEVEFVGEAHLHGHLLTLKHNSKEVKRKLNTSLTVKVEGNKIFLQTRKSTKKDKKNLGTNVAHIKNMVEGLNRPFVYKLQVATVHFPMTASYDKATNEIVVKNFLGEKKDRRIKLVEGVDVHVNKEHIEIRSVDIEKAGQSAANIEIGTKVRNKDRRIYQDGIFITEKPGRIFK